MRNFIILFHEKTGTSALVRLLDKFDEITILGQKKNRGLEPFDRHNCGPMTLNDLQRCLDIVFRQGPKDNEEPDQPIPDVLTVDEKISALRFMVRSGLPGHKPSA